MQNILFKFFIIVWILFIPMKTSYYQISAVGIILMFLINLYQKNNFYFLISKYANIIKAFSIIIVTMIISNTINYSLVDLYSWEIFFHFIFRYFLIFLILLYAYQENIISKKFIFITLLASLSIQALDGIFQAYYTHDIFKSNPGSLKAGLGGGTFNRNTFGMFMAIGASLLTGILFYKEKLNLNKLLTVFLYILFILFLWNLFLSYSRSSWISFTAFITIIYISNWKNIKFHNIFFFILLISSAFFIFYSEPSLVARFHQLIEGDSSHRYEIWQNTFDLIVQSPYFGHGLMTYDTVGLSNANAIQIASVHNSTLEIIFFLGLCGFLACSYFLFLILKKIYIYENKIYIAMFFALLLMLQFDQSVIKSIPMQSSLVIFGFFIFAKKEKEFF